MKLKKPLEVMVEHYYKDHKLEELGIEAETEMVMLPMVFYTIDAVQIALEPDSEFYQGCVFVGGGMFCTNLEYKELVALVQEHL